MMESEETIRRQGNSVGISLPQPLLRELGFSIGQTVSLQATPDGLLIRAKRPRYTAAEVNAMRAAALMADAMARLQAALDPEPA